MRKRILKVGKDKSIFKRTAVKSKDVNLGRVTMRGGIRF